MRDARRFVVGALVAIVALASSAGTAHAVVAPMYGSGMESFVAALAARRGLEAGSPERQAAIDRALLQFADPSTTFAEDVADLRKAVKALRAAYATDDPHGMNALIDTAVAAAEETTLVLNDALFHVDDVGTGRRLIAFTRLSFIEDEQKRVGRLAKLAKQIESVARRKHVALYA